MYEYPNLSLKPNFPIEESIENNVIRSSLEAGYELTRPRFTRVRKTFKLVYEILPEDDKVMLENFYMNDVKGAESFKWTHPYTRIEYIVKFAEPPNITQIADKYYKVEISLREV